MKKVGGEVWWRCPGLNGGPAAYESAALPTELHRRKGWYVIGHHTIGMIWRVSTLSGLSRLFGLSRLSGFLVERN